MPTAPHPKKWRHFLQCSRSCWLALACSITPFVAAAQVEAGFFRNFLIEQGLPSEYVSSVVQDASGFMWFGTNNGLVRYDGYVFVTYTHNPDNPTSLSSDYVRALAPLDERLLWVTLYETGLDLFDTKSGKTILHLNERTPIRLPDNRVVHLWVEKSKNRLWICTLKNHFVWLDLTTFRLTYPTFVKHPNSLVDVPETNSIYAIRPDGAVPGSYWMATNDGLVLFDENTNQTFYHQVPEQPKVMATSDRMRAMEMDGHLIWTGSRGGSGLNCFDKRTKTFTSYPYDASQNVNYVLSLVRKSANELWVGTMGRSLAVFNTDSRTYSFFRYDSKLPSDLKSDIIYDIAVDKEKNTWLATKKGVAMYNESYQYFKPDSLLTPTITKSPGFFKVWSILEDETSLYFGCSEADGLIVYDKKTKRQRLKRPPQLPAGQVINIYRMTKGNDGKIWLAALNYLLCYNPANGKFSSIERPKKMEGMYIHSVAVGTDGTVYCGSRRNGLFLYYPKKNVWENYRGATSKLVHDNYLHDLVIDNFGHLWISTGNGLSVFDMRTKKIIKNFGSSEGFKSIFKMTLDAQQRLWLSSENQGALCMDTKTLQQLPGITRQNGLLSNTIEYLAADRFGKLWLATHRGLCRYDLKTGDVWLFDAKNGLSENHVVGASYIMQNGDLVQGFEKTFSIVRPTLLADSELDRPPTFTDFKIFDLQYPVRNSDTLQLSYEQNFFSIGFSALNFTQAEKLKYQYRLIGINKNWVNANDIRTASYTNLAAGKYVFQARYAVKGKDTWSPVRQLLIRIESPFWETWWFYGLLFFGTTGITYAFYQSQIKAVRRREVIKAEMNRQLTALEMKSLRSQMNPHFIFNSLNSIKYYIIRNDTSRASKYLSQFSKLIRRILTNSENDFIVLYEEIETIKLYLEMEKLRFGKKLKYDVNVDPQLDTEMISIPTMLIQPYIENAIWHGIMHKETDGTLWVDVRENPADNNQIRITITDDGIGRENSQRLRSATTARKPSMGMRITGERIGLIRQYHNKDIRIDVSDLRESDVNTGTRVTLFIEI